MPIQMIPYHQNVGYQSVELVQKPMYSQQFGVSPQPLIIIPMHKPSPTACPLCHQDIGVLVRKRNGCAIWTYAVILCIFTGCCCWIPFVIDSCYDKEFICNGCLQVRRFEESECCCC
jgi:hypothetical protein